MEKFKPQAKPKPKKQITIVSVKIPTDLQDRFYALLETTGGTRSNLINQMIRFSMENM